MTDAGRCRAASSESMPDARRVDAWGKRPEDYATGETYKKMRSMLGKKPLPKALHMSLPGAGNS